MLTSSLLGLTPNTHTAAYSYPMYLAPQKMYIDGAELEQVIRLPHYQKASP